MFALRTVYEILTKKQLPKLEFDEVRGLAGVKEASVDINGKQLRVAVANGAGNVRKLLDKITDNEAYYDFVEIMACPGGCIGGGGQPKNTDPDILKKREASIYSLDERNKIRKSHENPAVKELYEAFLGTPNSELAHKILHTHYSDRSVKKVQEIVR